MLMQTTTDPTLAVNAKDPSFFKELGTRTAFARKERSITQARLAATLLPPSRIAEVMDFVEFHSQREERAAAAQRLTHQAGFSAMGKRMQVADLAKTNKDEAGGFGERLAGLREAASFTQVELAAELGISQRMVAYYESPAATPPANLLPQIATALGVSIDEMFGRTPKRKLAKQEGDSRLRRRLLAIEKLDVAEKRQVLQVIDAFIERGQLKRKAESRA